MLVQPLTQGDTGGVATDIASRARA